MWTAGGDAAEWRPQLLQAVIELARDLGCYKLQLMSHRERRQAHAFYERMPFLPSAQGYRRYL